MPSQQLIHPAKPLTQRCACASELHGTTSSAVRTAHHFMASQRIVTVASHDPTTIHSLFLQEQHRATMQGQPACAVRQVPHQSATFPLRAEGPEASRHELTT